MTMVYIIRHGSTAINESGVLQGTHQEGLSPLGRSQVAATAAFLRNKGLTTLYSSPLPRALESARIIAEATGAAIIPCPVLIERDYGRYDGHPLHEVAAMRAADGVASSDPLHDWENVPGVESDGAVWARVSAFLLPILRDCTAPALALVTHSGVIQACLYGALGVAPTRKLAFRIPRGMFTVWMWHQAALTLHGFYPDPFELKPSEP